MHSNITTFSQRTSLAKLIHELQPIHRHRTLCYSNIKPFSPNTNFPPRYALSSLTFPTTSSHFYTARLYPQVPSPPQMCISLGPRRCSNTSTQRLRTNISPHLRKFGVKSFAAYSHYAGERKRYDFYIICH